MVQGHIRGLSQYYVDGLERIEIWVPKSKASSLPYKENIRVPIWLTICSNSYSAGLRSTTNNEYVWISPDLKDSKSKKVSLARALIENGFKKSERIFLSVNGDVIHITHASEEGDK